jgi:acylphosphatase
MKTVHIEISGKVHGVFFRATAKEMAKLHDISGWIKNNRSGKVEALVTGKEEDIEKFISWCRIGPDRAAVEKVITTEKELQIFDKFEIIR